MLQPATALALHVGVSTRFLKTEKLTAGQYHALVYQYEAGRLHLTHQLSWSCWTEAGYRVV